ncbi:MAG: transglycosylase SLT domain-containing protein [Desulfuromonadales bacterium]|nr:transglycosylase SLT domain-containing protein [Desulfuromonadales bacterium]
MLHTIRKPLLIALASVSLFSLVSHSCHADDFLNRAVSLFREKNYEESLSLAKKSVDSSQRTFLMGVSALRQGKAEESLSLLAEAEQKLPLVGDYAAFYQVEALMALKKFREAAAKAATIPNTYPASLLIRKSEKIRLDICIAAGEYPGALKLSQAFIEKYPSGSDSVDALFLTGQSREETGDKTGAALIYRGLWLNNPLAPQAKKSRERLTELEKGGVKVSPFTAEELLGRATAFSAQNSFSQSLQTLQSISLDGQPAAVIDRVALRTGLNHYRLRSWKSAEKSLAKAATSSIASIRSEARFWQAKSLERLENNERAFTLFMALAAEGQKQEFADDALMEAAGLRKGLGSYTEAAGLYEQIAKVFPESKIVGRSVWEAGWCRYLAGEPVLAASAFKTLLKDEALREKALYWMGRALENGGGADAADYYAQLLSEYPSGFYATWYREQKGIKDTRESFARPATPSGAALPVGYEKPCLLASLGMFDEARNEVAAARKKNGDRKGQLPGLARLYQEMGDYASAIGLFLQNKTRSWDTESLPLWGAGYPLAYTAPVKQHTADNGLPESLVYALIRSESSFSPAVKSPAGAIGLMQLMPATARVTAREKGPFNPARLTTPDYNIMLGTRHFRELLKGFDGDVVYSVAAYNAGTSAVERWRKKLKGLKKDEFIESIPYQETRDYVKKVYATAATYRQLYGLR